MIASPDLDLAREIMRHLPQPTARRIAEATGAAGDRVARTLEGLMGEGLIEVRESAFRLTELGELVTADDRDGVPNGA